MDPNRSIVLMAPNEYIGGVKELAEDYGGEMHDTGAMGGFWVDQGPMISAGSGIPFSVEPGGAPRTLNEYKKMMGLYFSENIQGLDYFIHIGDVLWHDDIRKDFEDHLNLIHMVGKFHAPEAEVALLADDAVTSI